jgi:hypothetical protein
VYSIHPAACGRSGRRQSSLSCEVANRSESKEHEAVNAKAGYGGFGFSAQVDTDWSSDVDQMQSTTARRAQDRSEQTAQEFRSSHKVRRSVSREDGSEAWISDFIDRNGISPIKVLRQAWAKPLYDGALVAADFLAGGSEITSEQRELFRSTMLRFVRPSPGWIEPDEAGALRWGYEIFPTGETDALTFLYGFLPASA